MRQKLVKNYTNNIAVLSGWPKNIKNKVLRILVGYMRTYSEGDRQTTNLQRDALLQAGVDARNIFEYNVSGTKDKRHGLTAALDFLQKGDCLMVWKLNRVERSLSNLLDIISNFQANGIALRSLTEQMDTTTPHGELLFTLFGALAQYERALTRERIIAGLEAAKKRGHHEGRSRAIDEEKMEAILEVIKPGTSKASVCRNFGIKRSTLYDSLRRSETFLL